MAHIGLADVAVEFPIHNGSSRSLQLHMFASIGGRLAEHQKCIVVRALDGINLDVQDGDRVGIVGHNGAGKTTLLRVLAGVYQPTRGSFSIVGRLSSFTDITLGMDPEATGIDNIVFRSVFMGLSFAEARRLSPSIAEFSELGEYLKMPVRTYSTGMFVRLAFAISTAVEPDIIVMDEMIGAGDAQFVAKARGASPTCCSAWILVLATHDAAIMQSLCNKVIWLDHGQIRKIGSFEDVYPLYLAGTP